MTDPRLSDDWYWMLTLALLAAVGPGRYSLDALITRALKRVFPQLDGKPAFSLEGLPRVVIVGAGFGGLTCAARLANAPVRVTLIDRHNYHLFQPLLYQVATAGLSPGDIATPIRGLFRERFNAEVLLGEVTGVDAGAPGGPGRTAPRSVRSSRARHRRFAQLLRPRRVGALRARAQAHRGRHRGAPAHADRVRAGRGHRR